MDCYHLSNIHILFFRVFDVMVAPNLYGDILSYVNLELEPAAFTDIITEMPQLL